MTCREVTDFLLEYLSGTLAANERTEFELHLLECPDCVTYLRSYQETIQLGKAAFADPEAPVSDDVPEELVQAILSARATQSK
jgi:anti-sigma factor RsiW